VLELSPDDMRAQAALTTMPEPTPEPAPAERKSPAARKSATPSRPAPLATAKPTPLDNDAFVNLGDWLRDDQIPKDTRMVVAEEEPTGNEEADFQDMLRKFKQGVAENVEAEDYQSHYDLGVAYKEMGLIDEAISEFQKALRGPDNRVRTYEAIGQCFIEKGQNQMAATILARALNEKGMDDDQLVGVLYLLGRAYEALGKGEDALQYYQRVFVVDIQFHDVGERMNALENATR
jgi:tetratricopeptide (TPR) repeat protein